MSSKAVTVVFSCTPIANLISQFVGEPHNTLPVCKSFSAPVSRTLKAKDSLYQILYNSYPQCTFLRSYIPAIQLSPKTKVPTYIIEVQKVYIRVLQKACEKAPVPLAIDSLNSLRLDSLIREADLLTFFDKVAEKLFSSHNISTARDFFNGLTGDIYYRGALVREWMDANKETLKIITILQLENCGLFSLPQEIRFFTGLEWLDLDHNQLKFLPDEIGLLSKLEVLYLSHNQLEALPSQFCQLSALHWLELNYNQLKVLPDEIGLLSLLGLGLSNNRLRALPNQITTLTQLGSLDLNDNQLTALPDQIGQLSELRTLNLNHNKLTALPDEIGQLHLETLILAGNLFKGFPENLRDFLEGLNITELSHLT